MKSRCEIWNLARNSLGAPSDVSRLDNPRFLPSKKWNFIGISWRQSPTRLYNSLGASPFSLGNPRVPRNERHKCHEAVSSDRINILAYIGRSERHGNPGLPREFHISFISYPSFSRKASICFSTWRVNEPAWLRYPQYLSFRVSPYSWVTCCLGMTQPASEVFSQTRWGNSANMSPLDRANSLHHV